MNDPAGPERVDPIRELQLELRGFAAARGWERYHTPRNLAALISSEAGELLAHFRWDEDALEKRPDEVHHEVADVFLGLLRFADVAGLDLVDAAHRKLRINAANYPVGEEPAGPDRKG